MKISNKSDFFQKPLKDVHPVAPKDEPRLVDVPAKPETKKGPKIFASTSVVHLVKQTSEILSICGLHSMSKRVEQFLRDTAKERFTVSVVGEFSRGKSTLLNNLLDNAAMLPVGNLPTTAIMTRIRFANQTKMAVFDEKGSRVAMLDVKPESWDNLVANNFGEKQPQGSIIVGIPNQWLASNNMELIDCPGAGDLSEERTKQIANTLERTDGAIICLTATSALAQTEKEFILQRILKQKTPFSIIVINKLDLVKKEQRNGIVDYVHNVLKLNNMNIPVYIPDVEMPDDTYDNIKGIERIKDAISSWANDPRRQALTDLWIKSRVLDVVFMASDALKEQQKVLDVAKEKSQEIILNKKNALEKLELLWSELEINLQEKSNECYIKFMEKVKEYTDTTIERLQHEANHTASPDKWWQEDYPYRLKVELANMSVGLDNLISQIIARDVRWFNQMLDQKFKNFIQIESTSVTDKADYIAEKSNRKVEFEDLNRKQNFARLGTTALCIASYFTPLGFMGSMGIGAGGAILQSTFFKKKIEEQKAQLKDSIAKDIPQIVDNAISKSEIRIKMLYNSILEQSEKKKDLWKEAQFLAIETENKPKTEQQQKELQNHILELESIIKQLN